MFNNARFDCSLISISKGLSLASAKLVLSEEGCLEVKGNSFRCDFGPLLIRACGTWFCPQMLRDVQCCRYWSPPPLFDFCRYLYYYLQLFIPSLALFSLFCCFMLTGGLSAAHHCACENLKQENVIDNLIDYIYFIYIEFI